jgi:hypothetical protein
MFENKESMGRIGKWATELAEHVINFISRSATKSQVLAGFVADWTPSAMDEILLSRSQYGKFNVTERIVIWAWQQRRFSSPLLVSSFGMRCG